MKKRIITFVLAGMMVIVLVGCGTNTASIDSATSEGVEQVAEIAETKPIEAVEIQVEDNAQDDIVIVEEVEVLTVEEEVAADENNGEKLK